MSVRRRQNWQGQQRVDVPHLKSVESAISNDFDELINGLVIGEDQSYIVRGFSINIPGSIGSSANGLQLLVEDSAFLHGGSDESGTFFTIPVGTPAEVLSSTTNTRVEGAFTPSTDNYIGIEFVRAVDDATADQVYFWNPTTNVEITKTVPLAIILDYKIVISTSSFASNVMPVSIVQTDSSNNVISITDRRPLLYRLGTAGDASPDPFYSYPWSDGRSENFYTSTSSTSDPFLGGDKQITTMKEFFDALMTEFKTLKGTPFWYSASAGSISRLRQDAANTAFTGKGNVIHGAFDFQGQVAGMTTDVIVKTAGFSAPPGITLTGDGVTDLDALILAYNIANPDDTIFLYSGDGSQVINDTIPLELTSKAGQLNWDADTYLNFIGGRLRYTVTANPASTNITLSDNEVAYLNLVRGVDVIPNLIFTNGGTVVTSVGSVPWTTDLVAGDFIKDASKGDENYYEILSVDPGNFQVTLTTPFLETSSGLSGFDAQYSFGIYEANPAPSTDRHIQIADRALVPFDEDAFWLYFRQDDTGSLVKVYARVLGGQELEQGESQNISDNTSLDLLNFIGAASETDNSPDYVNSVITAIAEVTTFTSDLAANFVTGQYFRINSAGDANQYYVWVNKDGGGGDPTPAGLTGLEVAVTTGESAITTAGSLSTAINSLSSFNSVDNLDGTFTVTNTLLGITTDAINVDMGGSFSLLVDTPGVGEANHYVIDGEHLVRSIKRLDQATHAASIGLAKLARQNENDKLINGGVWSWDLGTTTLTNDALAHIQIPGLNDERNEIAIQSIILANDNDVAYVERNLDIGVDAVITVNVAQVHTVVMTDNTLVIARREGNDVIVGSSSTKLESGESARLYSTRSSFDNQDKNKKVIEGGTWSFGPGTPLPASIIEEQLVISDTINIDTNTYNLTQAFKHIPSNFNLQSIDLYMNWSGDTAGPDGNMRLQIWDALEITVLATILVDMQSNIDETPTVSTINFLLPTPISLLANTEYRFKLDFPGVNFFTGDERVNIKTATGDVYANGDTWAQFNAGNLPYPDDITFKINAQLPVSALSWDTDSYIQIPGLTNVRNTLLAQEVVLNTDEVAYVNINREVGAADNLTVNVANINTIDDNDDDLAIIARRTSLGVLVGESFLLKDGEFLELDGALAEINRYHGQLVVTPENPISQRVTVSGSDILKLSGSSLSLEQKNLLLDFPGVIIDFSSGEILNLNETQFNGGINDFIPFVIGANEYFFYSVSVLPNTVNLNNTISGQILILPSIASNAVLADAPRAPFPASGIKLANVWVKGIVDGLVVEELHPEALSAQSGARGFTETRLKMAQPFTASSSYSAGQIKLYFKSSYGIPLAGDFEVSLYTDNAGEPGILMSTSPDLVSAPTIPLISTGAQYTFNLPSTPLISGTQYWIHVEAINGYDTNGGGQLTSFGRWGSAVPHSDAIKKFEGAIWSDVIGGGTIQHTDYEISSPLVTVEDVNYANITQLGVGGSGSGSGDANELLERLKNIVDEGNYEVFTPNIFSTNNDELIDELATTATFDVANTLYKFEFVGEVLTSIQMLDDQFLTESKDVSRVKLVAYWDLENSKLDQQAVYEVSRDGGNEYQTVAMQRIPGTDTYTSDYVFTDESTFANTIEHEEVNADAILELTDTGAGVQRAQIFSVTGSAFTAMQLSTYLDIQNAGGLAGSLCIQIVEDSATQSTGTITLDNDIALLALDAVEVNGTTHTQGGDWNTGSSAIEAATNLAILINAANIGTLTADNEEGTSRVITVTADTAGIAGDAITMSYTDSGAADLGVVISGATLSGGVDGGLPTNSIIYETTPINLGAEVTGTIVDVRTLKLALAIGDYHIVWKTNAEYKAGYITGVDAVSMRVDASAPAVADSSVYDGTTWTDSAAGASVYLIEGRNLDLRVRFTSGNTEVALVGYGIYYDYESNALAQSGLQRDVQEHNGDDNPNTFIVNGFVPDPQMLFIYEIGTGGVFRAGLDFIVDGQSVTFEADTFDKPGETFILEFMQIFEGSFQFDTLNRLAIAGNFLGNPNNPNLDFSQNGRGIFLRRPDGTLRELTINNADGIDIYSV